MGIDPGISGAIAIYEPKFNGVVAAARLPILQILKGREKHTELNVPALRSMLSHMHREHNIIGICLEKVSASPQMGVSSSFSFGRTYGRIEALIESDIIPIFNVTASVWKQKMKVSAEKNLAKQQINKIFHAGHNDIRNHNVAEAAALAYYAWHHCLATLN